MNLALTLAALDLTWSAEPRRAWLAALPLGLGLANHHYLTVLAGPAVLMAWLAHGQPLRRILGMGALALALALLAYSALALRGPLPTLVNWARPGGAGALWDTVTARVFHSSIGARVGSVQPADPLWNLFAVGGMLASSLTLPLLGAGLAGLLVAARRAPRALLPLIWLAAVAWLAKGLMDVDPTNPDDHGYLLPGLVGIALGVPLLLTTLSPPRVLGALALACVAGTALLGASRLPTLDHAAFDAPDRVRDALVRELRPGGVCLPWYYPLHFLALEKLVVEGSRPDLVPLHPSLDAKLHGGPPTARDMRRRFPELGPVLDGLLRRGAEPAPPSPPIYREPAPDQAPFAGAWTDAGWWQRPAACVGCPPPYQPDLAALGAALGPWLATDVVTRRVVIHLAATGARVRAEQGRHAEARALLDALSTLLPSLGRLPALPGAAPPGDDRPRG